MISAAASFYKAAISVTSGLSSPLNNLAVIYKQQVVFFPSFCLIILQLQDNKVPVLMFKLNDWLNNIQDPHLLFLSLISLFCICTRETMLMLSHVTLKYFVQILQQLMHQLIEGTHSKRLAELMKQFRIMFRQQQLGQTWQKPMPTWPQHTRTGIFYESQAYAVLMYCI